MLAFFLISCGEDKKEEVVLKLPELPDVQTNIGTSLDSPIFSCMTLDQTRLILFHNNEADIFSLVYGDLLKPRYQLQQFSNDITVEKSNNPALTEGGIRISFNDSVTTATITLLYRDSDREGVVELNSKEEGGVDTFCIPGTIQTELHREELWERVNHI